MHIVFSSTDTPSFLHNFMLACRIVLECQTRSSWSIWLHFIVFAFKFAIAIVRLQGLRGIKLKIHSKSENLKKFMKIKRSKKIIKTLSFWYYQGNTSYCVFLYDKATNLWHDADYTKHFMPSFSRGERHLSHYHAKETQKETLSDLKRR